MGCVLLLRLRCSQPAPATAMPLLIRQCSTAILLLWHYGAAASCWKVAAQHSCCSTSCCRSGLSLRRRSTLDPPRRPLRRIVVSVSPGRDRRNDDGLSHHYCDTAAEQVSAPEPEMPEPVAEPESETEPVRIRMRTFTRMRTCACADLHARARTRASGQARGLERTEVACVRMSACMHARGLAHLGRRRE